MSLQQVIEFWTYLQAQAKLKLQAFIDVRSGSSYKDEMRAEAEAYEGLGKIFSKNFEPSIRSADDIRHGLTGEQVAGFLDYLDLRTTELKAALERIQRKREEALASAQDMDYYRVKNIYKDMQNLQECQIGVVENSRHSFMGILQKS